MKTNLYYQTVILRRNVIKDAILKFFFGLCSYPRLLLEVFIRKNFGVRYFNLASAITVASVLILLPILQHNGMRLFAFMSPYGYRQPNFWTIGNATWYLFIGLFLAVSLWRWNEMRKNPSTFDFSKFSRYSGDIHPRFWKFDLFGLVKNDLRKIEIYWEPAFFLLIGIALIMLNQKVGNLIVFASIFYSIGYAGAYKEGDDFLHDLMDKKKFNDHLAEAIMSDRPDSEAHGVRFYAQKPSSESLRKDLIEQIIIDEPVVFAI